MVRYRTRKSRTLGATRGGEDNQRYVSKLGLSRFRQSYLESTLNLTGCNIVEFGPEESEITRVLCGVLTQFTSKIMTRGVV